MLPEPSQPQCVRPRCTVRGCERLLERATKGWSCAQGHAFDIARSGYVNLLQPGDRRSLKAGDSSASVAARWRMEQRGLGQALRAEIESLVARLELPARSPALDLGAGTGALLAGLVARFDLEGWALDLSTPAVDRGARQRPELAWVVANADRSLPFPDASFALLLSTTGPKQPAEFRRVLAPGGTLLLTVPAADDLIELRGAAQGEAKLEDRVAPALALFEPYFSCQQRSVSRITQRLERTDIEDLLAATYRGARNRERARMRGLDALETTLSSEILQLLPR